MQRIPIRWREVRRPVLDRRIGLPALVLAVILSLVLFTLFAVDFNRQRGQQRQLEAELARNAVFLATAQPAATEVAQLEIQLRNAQQRLAQAQAALPGPDQQVGIVQRILLAAEASGVSVTQLQATGTETRGAVTEVRYSVAARGSVQAVGDFAARLEREAFPAARLREVRLAERDGQNELSGTLVIYGSSLPGNVVAVPTQSPAERAAILRSQYQQAIDEQDYETALSILTRLQALEPTATDLDDLLYQTYVAYGEYLLALDRAGLAEEQCSAALAIRSDGEEAVLCLLKTAAARTPAPGTPSVVIPGIIPTATPIPFATATEANPTALPPTVAPPPTNTPRATQFVPTQVIPTATPSGPTSTATSAPSPYLFTASQPFFRPNCFLTMAFGKVQTENGTPLNGVRVRVWWDGAADSQAYSLPSGEDPTKPAGYWDVVLDDYAKPGRWYAQIIDRQSGRELSPKVTFETDNADCRTGGIGHQVVEINFTRVGSEPVGTPAPTSTNTPIPSATLFPSSTPTKTATPTITATPTATAIVVANNEDFPIPDDAEKTIVSPVTVPASVDAKVRYVVVYVNIYHPNAGDLEVTLVSPAGTRVTLHRRGQDSGSRNLQREFNPSNVAELGTAFKDQNARGTWKLEVTDKVEPPGNVTPTPAPPSVLAQWELAIYP